VAYDPEIIIMDGPVVTAYPNLILPAALAHTDRYLKLPQILISPLLGKAPLIGAAVRIIQSLDTSK
jgi:glucokinase